MKLLVLPTWLLVRLFNSFLPNTHPWKNRKFKLHEWSNGSTDTTIALSIILWGNFLSLVFTLTYLILR